MCGARFGSVLRMKQRVNYGFDLPAAGEGKANCNQSEKKSDAIIANKMRRIRAHATN